MEEMVLEELVLILFHSYTRTFAMVRYYRLLVTLPDLPTHLSTTHSDFTHLSTITYQSNLPTLNQLQESPTHNACHYKRHHSSGVCSDPASRALLEMSKVLLHVTPDFSWSRLNDGVKGVAKGPARSTTLGAELATRKFPTDEDYVEKSALLLRSNLSGFVV